MTDLLGPSYLGQDGYLYAEAWARRRGGTIDFVDNARRYWTLCDAAGIRPEVAYAQHAKETGFGRFGGVLDTTFHNPCGLKVARPQDAPWPDSIPSSVRARGSDYNPNAHERFSTWDAGVRAHVNHLIAYVHGKRAIPEGRTLGPLHGRFHVILTTAWAGTVASVEDLWHWNGTQAYAQSLLKDYVFPLMSMG